VPSVEDGNRVLFEKAVRADGHPDFEISEQTPDGRTVPAAKRAEYFPVQYARAFNWNLGEQPPLGIDYGTDPDSWAAIQKAIDTGGKRATGWTTLPDGAALFKVFFPVYRDGVPGLHPFPVRGPVNGPVRQNSLTGFLVAVIDVREIVGIDEAPTDEHWGTIHFGLTHDMKITLYDRDSGSPPLIMHLRGIKGPSRPSFSHRAGLQLPGSFPVANRQWHVEIKPWEE
jgi:CHASE1-domain containing sensor protein